MKALLKTTAIAHAASIAFGVFVPTAGAQDQKQEPQQTPEEVVEALYGKEAMQRSLEKVRKAAGGMKQWFVITDRFEYQSGDGEDTFLWDAQGWYGSDINKLWIKTEGEYSFEEDTVEDAEIQALWSRAISPFFDFQAGVRYDFEPSGLAHGVIGLQGLAPYWFELDAAAFVSEKGDITASVEAEYEMLFTQRLILQPRLELGFSFQDIPERETGSGFTDLSAGLRLRYEIKREFAPYIGFAWQRSLVDTADFARLSGGDVSRTVFTLGIRAWF